jgi:Flp pilus assembly protein TadB
MRNKKIKDGWLLWLLLLLVAVIVFVGMMAIAKPLPLIALPIIVVGAIVILAWIFGSSQQPPD